MASKDQVIAIHKLHPDWSSGQIAEELNCESSYVRATFYRNGLKLPIRAAKSDVITLGEACINSGIKLSDIIDLAERRRKR